MSHTIVMDALYTSEQIVSAMKISRETLNIWIKSGLRFSRRNTKRQYFLGRHIIEFLFEGNP